MNASSFFKNIQIDDKSSSGDKIMQACFKAFDSDKDLALNAKEFDTLTRALLTNANGEPYSLSVPMVTDLFYAFDVNNDGKIDAQEFQDMWKKWIKPVLCPVTALLIIDVQNDFINGSLSLKNCPAGQDGAEVVPVINNLLDTVKFNVVAYSYDYHPIDHVSFYDNVDERKFHSSSKIAVGRAKLYDTVVFEGPPTVEQKLWPRHCVQKTWGSELHPQLKIVEDPVFVYKGTNSDVDSYSAFWDNSKLAQTNLDSELKKRNVTDVIVCGLAFDCCVGFTCLHALELGYRTALIDDASRCIDEAAAVAMREKLNSLKGIVVTSGEVKDLVEGKDRNPELAYYLGTFTSSCVS